MHLSINQHTTTITTTTTHMLSNINRAAKNNPAKTIFKSSFNKIDYELFYSK